MNLKVLTDLILDHPELPNTQVGRLAGASTRTVYRYRRLLGHQNLTAADRVSHESVCRRLNRPRYRPEHKAAIDWHRLQDVLAQPNATLRDAWEDYRASQPMPHLGYSRFRRKVRAHYTSVYVLRIVVPTFDEQS